MPGSKALAGKDALRTALVNTGIWLLVFLSASSSAAAQGVAPAHSEKLTQLELCLAKQVAAQRKNDDTLPAAITAHTRLFLFEEYLKAIGNPKPNVLLEDPDRWCRETLIPRYLKSHQAGLKQRLAETEGKLAPLGTAPIESSSAFVQTYQNVIGSHVSGHSDLTNHALGQLKAFSNGAKLVLARTSQLPDLYRWHDDSYHAHTPPYEPGNVEDRKRKSQAGLQSFRKLLRQLIDIAQETANADDIASAFVVLGAAFHMVQDLVYHNGMTLQQHSGLAYLLDRNPDFPPGEAGVRSSQTAIALTRAVANSFLEKLSPSAKARIASWIIPEQFDMRSAAGKIYGPKEQISVPALLSYWHLHNDYRNGLRPKEELIRTPCDSSNGLVCWGGSAAVQGLLPKEAIK